MDKLDPTIPSGEEDTGASDLEWRLARDRRRLAGKKSSNGE